MKVILISGKARHGKDTAAEILERHLKNAGYRVLVAHYADLLKYICKTFFGWDGNKDESGRNLLQTVGTNTIRKVRPDYWADFIADVLSFFPDAWDYVLIPDCRFPNEVERMKDKIADTTLVRVARHNFDSGLTEEQLNHPSETALDDYPADQYFDNDGTVEALENKIKTWIGEITYE